MTAETKLTVHSPADLVAALPYLIGFHPADSVAVLALRRGRMIFAGRQDLPPPDEAPADARYLAWVARRQDADAAAIIGYGDPARVTPAVLATEEALRGVGVRVLDPIRVTGDRFWSYRDEDCPADGWPLPPAHRMRVWLVRIVSGEPAPLEDHDDIRVLGPGEWLDVPWLPADVPVVRALNDRHRRAG